VRPGRQSPGWRPPESASSPAPRQHRSARWGPPTPALRVSHIAATRCVHVLRRTPHWRPSRPRWLSRWRGEDLRPCSQARSCRS
jgi:hypothetical protein